MVSSSELISPAGAETASTAAAPGAAYVHIPFCRRRCFYCDFPIAVIGERQRGETSPGIQSYVDWLCREILATPSLGRPLETIFFGGGTPSLLSVAQVDQVLQTLAQQFGLTNRPEISMEMDPATFDRSHLSGYTSLGISRISLGVQAFQDELLERCGRFHRRQDVDRAIELVQGVPSWSLDLMSGLPGQTLDQWQQSLDAAIAAAPSHLSVYDLVIEPQTPFGKQYRPGETPLPSESQTVAMYRQAQAALTAAGYDHYEISNYARPGHRCRHNLTYWCNQPFYGFGMGATSYVGHCRMARPRTRKTYRQWVAAYEAAGGQATSNPEPPREQLTDGLMVGLRLAEGVAVEPLVSQLGPEFLPMVRRRLAPYLEAGQVVLTAKRLRLSDPDGFLVSNTVLVELFNGIDDLG